MATNWIFGITILLFFVSVSIIIGTVSGDIVLNQNNGSIIDALDTVEEDAGLINGVFIAVARASLGSLDDFGEEYGNPSLFSQTMLGFASLPDWLNLFIVALFAIGIVSIGVSLFPAVGS